jgi:hypothetical protein
MGRRVASIATPGRLIVIQEGWSLSNHLWVQPEPVTRTNATLEGNESTQYQEWHMFASQSDHESWSTPEARSRRPTFTTKAAISFFDGHATTGILGTETRDRLDSPHHQRERAL